MPPTPRHAVRHALGISTLILGGALACSSERRDAEQADADVATGGGRPNPGSSDTVNRPALGLGGAATAGGASSVGGTSTTATPPGGARSDGIGGARSDGIGGARSDGIGGARSLSGTAVSGGTANSTLTASGSSTAASSTTLAHSGSGGVTGPQTSTSSYGGGTVLGGASSGGANNGGKASVIRGGATNASTAGGSSAANSGGKANSSTTPIKVWIAGDSTVQNCSSTCPCGWGSQFDALFNSSVTVVNSAVGGRSIQTWLYEGNVSSSLGKDGECTLTSTAYNSRWTNMTNGSTGMKPGDYLLIQFGINDGDTSCPRHVGTTLYKSYLTEMAKAAKALGAQPIFLTPTSAIECSGSTAKPTRGFLNETKAAGTENAVSVIDLHQLSINLYNQLGMCPNSADYTSTTSKLGQFFCEDHTHFEAAGAKQIAQTVARALQDQGIGLAAYLL